MWTPGQYHRLRFYLNAIALAVTALIGVLVGVSTGLLVVLVIVSFGKAAESTSQMLYGYFQARERLDLVSRSLLLRAALGAAGFVTGLIVSSELAPACVGLLAGWLFTYIVHDRPVERRLLRTEPVSVCAPPVQAGIVSLARKAAPLGIDAGVGSLATNIPRYGVQMALGSAQLGVFASLAYLGQVVAMITGSLADSTIGRLAILADRKAAAAFTRLLGQLIAFGVGVAVLAAAGAALVGDEFVRLLLGREYVNRSALVLLMLGAGIITVQRCLGRGLQATHRYAAVLAVDSVTLLATMGFAIYLIPRFGLAGAAITLGLGFLVGSVVAGVLLFRTIREMRIAERTITP